MWELLIINCFYGSVISPVIKAKWELHIRVTTIVIMSCFRGFGLRFDDWLSAWAPQHWLSCKSRSRYKEKCINSDYSLSIYGLVVWSVVCSGATALVELRVQEQVEEASQDINLRNGFCHDDQVDQVVDDDEGVPDDEHHLLFLGSHHVKHWSQAESYHSTKKLIYLVSIIKFSFPVKISFQFTKKRIDLKYLLSNFQFLLRMSLRDDDEENRTMIRRPANLRKEALKRKFVNIDFLFHFASIIQAKKLILVEILLLSLLFWRSLSLIPGLKNLDCPSEKKFDQISRWCVKQALTLIPKLCTSKRFYVIKFQDDWRRNSSIPELEYWIWLLLYSWCNS